MKTEDLVLYAVTDRHWLRGETLVSQVEKAVKGGATFIQLREKKLNTEEFMSEAKEIQKLCRKYNVPFVINDNVEIAKEIGIHIADKADSQDICFIPDGDYAAFISENIDKDIESGDFVDKTGKKLGTHKGIIHYTIGQRKGLNLPMGHPVFVTDINVRDNQVVIGESEDLFTTRVVASQFNYMAVEKMEPGEEYIGKIRYAHKGTKCKVVKTWEDKVEIEFEEPVRAVTPGQNLVLYMGEYVAGGGVIIRG